MTLKSFPLDVLWCDTSTVRDNTVAAYLAYIMLQLAPLTEMQFVIQPGVRCVQQFDTVWQYKLYMGITYVN